MKHNFKKDAVFLMALVVIAGLLPQAVLADHTAEDIILPYTKDVPSYVNEVDEIPGEKLAESTLGFTVADENGDRLVRIRGCNMAEFNADAYYYYLNEVDGMGCDIAFVNGGGVCADASSGDWTYKTMKSINPFGNVICLMEMTGRQILDAVEWGARSTTGKTDSPEEGGFLHTAGLIYEIDDETISTVWEEEGIWQDKPTEAYRIHNIKVYNKETKTYEPLILNRTYTVAGAGFILRNFGDGFAMFEGATLVKDDIVEDYMALAAYAKAFRDSDGDGYADISSENSPLSAYEGYLLDYESTGGSGRITFSSEKPKELPVIWVVFGAAAIWGLTIFVVRWAKKKEPSAKAIQKSKI